MYLCIYICIHMHRYMFLYVYIYLSVCILKFEYLFIYYIHTQVYQRLKFLNCVMNIMYTVLMITETYRPIHSYVYNVNIYVYISFLLTSYNRCKLCLYMISILLYFIHRFNRGSSS